MQKLVYLLVWCEDITWILVFKELREDRFNPIFIPNGKIFVKLSRKQMVEIYNMADFVIIPSYFESFGLVAIEAGLCNTPVISSKTGWIEETGLTDYGIVLNSFKPEDFSNAIDEIFNYNIKPRKYMQKRFDFQKWIEKWKNLIGD